MMKKFILALISMSLLLASGCAHIEEYDTEETADTEETTEVQTETNSCKRCAIHFGEY